MFINSYRKYINSVEKTDLGKAQQQNAELEKALGIYKSRLCELSLKLPKSELESMLFKMGIKDILDLPEVENGALTNGNTTKANSKSSNTNSYQLKNTFFLIMLL